MLLLSAYVCVTYVQSLVFALLYHCNRVTYSWFLLEILWGKLQSQVQRVFLQQEHETFDDDPGEREWDPEARRLQFQENIAAAVAANWGATGRSLAKSWPIQHINTQRLLYKVQGR